MATISLSDAAPKDETVRFVIAGSDFDLKGDAVYETTDANLLVGAVSNPWLKVTPDKKDAEQPEFFDMTDPHFNPSLDHLSGRGSPETIAAADAADAQIQAAAFPPEYTQQQPAQVQESVSKPTPAPVEPAQTPAPAAQPVPTTEVAN